MVQRMVLLLLLIIMVGLGGCYWHDGGREEYRPGGYRQGYNSQVYSYYPQGSNESVWYFRRGANTPGYEYDGAHR
jgi:hypothetical protein